MLQKTKRSLALGSVVVTLLWSSLGPAGDSPGQEATRADYHVAEVVIKGNKHLSIEFILSHIEARPKGYYSQGALEEDVRRLNKTGMFSSISVHSYPVSAEKTIESWVRLEYTVVEYPNVISDIQIRGVKPEREAQFQSLFRLRKGVLLNPGIIKEFHRQIAMYYQANGYVFAQVELIEGSKREDSRVILEVNEGPKVTVRNIRFEGNKKRLTLVRRALRRPPTWFPFELEVGKVYSESSLRLSRSSLEDIYSGDKPLSGQAVPELIFSENGDQVDIIFHVK